MLKAEDAKGRIRVRELFVEKAPQIRVLVRPQESKAHLPYPWIEIADGLKN